MILSDTEIRAAMERREIVVEPFDPEALGSNSYDVHLGRTLAVYEDEILDAKKHNKVRSFDIPDDGYVLLPLRTYLGVTLEYTETHQHVPFLEGKSSLGRPGTHIHRTRGKGHGRSCNTRTLQH